MSSLNKIDLRDSSNSVLSGGNLDNFGNRAVSGTTLDTLFTPTTLNCSEVDGPCDQSPFADF